MSAADRVLRRTHEDLAAAATHAPSDEPTPEALATATERGPDAPIGPVGSDRREPRQYTGDEVRQKFLDHLAAMARYWLNEDRAPSATEKLTGFGHSFLTMLDGYAGLMPAWVVAPSPHPDDEEFHRGEGENWYPRVEPEHDIAGELRYGWLDACRRVGLR